MGVRPGEQVVAGGAADRVEADRVVAAGVDHPPHTGPPGRLEHHVRAVDVDPQDAVPGVLAADAGQVDDGVDIPAGGEHRVRVGDVGAQHFLAGGGIGQRRQIDQPQHPARPGQPWPQQAADTAGRTGDQDPLPLLCHPLTFRSSRPR